MALSFNPFICLNDHEELDEYIKRETYKKPLNVQRIFIGYPITEDGEMEQFYHNEEKPITTLRDLLLEITAIINREVEAGHNYASHCVDDYCIEIVEVTDDICCVDIGS